MKIHNNIPAMTANRYLNMHQQRAARSIYRLSTGKRINSAADDPAGMAIAQRFRAQLRELGVHIKNAELRQLELEGQHAESGIRQDILSRMREIAVRVSGDTLSPDEKKNLMLEYQEIAKELTVSTYRKAGMEVVTVTSGKLSGEMVFKHGEMIFHEGEWQRLDTFTEIDPFSGEASKPTTVSLIDHVADMISRNLETQAGISAEASALSFRLDRLYTEESNAAEALSRIEDVDFALEIAELAKAKILTECATAMSAQANALPKNVLYLLEAI